MYNVNVNHIEALQERDVKKREAEDNGIYLKVVYGYSRLVRFTDFAIVYWIPSDRSEQTKRNQKSQKLFLCTLEEVF